MEAEKDSIERAKADGGYQEPLITDPAKGKVSWWIVWLFVMFGLMILGVALKGWSFFLGAVVGGGIVAWAVYYFNPRLPSVRKNRPVGEE